MRQGREKNGTMPISHKEKGRIPKRGAAQAPPGQGEDVPDRKIILESRREKAKPQLVGTQVRDDTGKGRTECNNRKRGGT